LDGSVGEGLAEHDPGEARVVLDPDVRLVGATAGRPLV